MLDIDVANQHGVEQQLWRSVFYNVIEGLRHQVTENTPNDSPVRHALTEILDEVTLESLITFLLLIIIIMKIVYKGPFHNSL